MAGNGGQVTISIDGDTRPLKKELASLAKSLRDLTLGVKLDDAQFATLKARIKALNATDVKLKADLDATALEGKLKAVRALAQQKVQMRLDFDTTHAKSQLAAMELLVKDLNRRSFLLGNSAPGGAVNLNGVLANQAAVARKNYLAQSGYEIQRLAALNAQRNNDVRVAQGLNVPNGLFGAEKTAAELAALNLRIEEFKRQAQAALKLDPTLDIRKIMGELATLETAVLAVTGKDNKIDLELNLKGLEKLAAGLGIARAEVQLTGEQIVQRQLDSIRDKLLELELIRATLTVDAEIGRAEAKIAFLESEMAKLGSIHNIRVNVLSGEAAAEIAALSNELKALDSQAVGEQVSRRSGARGLTTLGLGVGIGDTVFAGAGVAISAFALKANADIETVKVAFQGLLGDTEGIDFLDRLREFSRLTPFTLDEVTNSAQRLLGSQIVQADKVIDTIRRIGGVAATLGEGNDAIEGTIRALSQIKGQGKPTAQEIRQIANQLPGFNAFEGIAAELTGKAINRLSSDDVRAAMDAVTDGAVSADQAISGILKQMDQFPGAAAALARQAETLKGRFSTLKETLQDAAVQGFGKLSTVAKSTVDGLVAAFEDGGRLRPVLLSVGDSIAAAIGPVAQQLPDLLGGLAEGVNGFFTALGPGLGNALGTIGPQLGGLGAGLGKITASAIEAGSALASGLIPVFSLFTNTIGSVPGLLSAVVIGITGLKVATGAAKLINDLGFGLTAFKTAAAVAAGGTGGLRGALGGLSVALTTNRSAAGGAAVANTAVGTTAAAATPAVSGLAVAAGFVAAALLVVTAGFGAWALIKAKSAAADRELKVAVQETTTALKEQAKAYAENADAAKTRGGTIAAFSLAESAGVRLVNDLDAATPTKRTEELAKALGTLKEEAKDLGRLTASSETTFARQLAVDAELAVPALRGMSDALVQWALTRRSSLESAKSSAGLQGSPDQAFGKQLNTLSKEELKSANEVVDAIRAVRKERATEQAAIPGLIAARRALNKTDVALAEQVAESEARALEARKEGDAGAIASARSAARVFELLVNEEGKSISFLDQRWKNANAALAETPGLSRNVALAMAGLGSELSNGVNGAEELADAVTKIDGKQTLAQIAREARSIDAGFVSAAEGAESFARAVKKIGNNSPALDKVTADLKAAQAILDFQETAFFDPQNDKGTIADKTKTNDAIIALRDTQFGKIQTLGGFESLDRQIAAYTEANDVILAELAKKLPEATAEAIRQIAVKNGYLLDVTPVINAEASDLLVNGLKNIRGEDGKSLKSEGGAAIANFEADGKSPQALALAAMLGLMTIAPENAKLFTDDVLAEAKAAFKDLNLEFPAKVIISDPAAEAARAQYVAAQYLLNHPGTLPVKVEVEDASAEAAAALGRTQYYLSQHPLQVEVGYVFTGGPDAPLSRYNSNGTTFLAEGGVVEFYRHGGVRSQDAPHVAHIARGATRVFNEPETGGEGYIPLSAAKRGRSEAIMAQIAARFGGEYRSKSQAQSNSYGIDHDLIGHAVARHLAPALKAVQRAVVNAGPVVNVTTNSSTPEAHGARAYWAVRERQLARSGSY